MSHIPYLKTEDVRDCTREAQVSMFSFSSPKWKTKIYYWQTLPKYLNLYMNHNLTLKLKKISIPITQRFSKAYDTFIKHIMYPNHRETNA